MIPNEAWDVHIRGECLHNPTHSRSLMNLLFVVTDPRRFNPHALQHLMCVAEAIGCPPVMMRHALNAEGFLLQRCAGLDTGVVQFTHEPASRTTAAIWTYHIPEVEVTSNLAALRDALGPGHLEGQDPLRDFHVMARLLTAHLNGDSDTVDALMRAIAPEYAMLAVTRQAAFHGMLELAIQRAGENR